MIYPLQLPPPRPCDRPILLCAGGYEVAADEVGNKAQTGGLALAVLDIDGEVRTKRGRAAIRALSELVQWAENFHSRLYRCPKRCGACGPAREHYARIGVYLDEEV